MTRIGKIARLPKDIRDVVNKRLLDGHSAVDIIAWLNEQPAVKAVLEKDFDGEAVSLNNVSTWKKGGYHDWREEIEALSSRCGGIASFINRVSAVKLIATPELPEDISLFLAATLAVECEQIDYIADEEERMKALSALLDAYAQLRGANLTGSKYNLERQKLEDLKQAAERRIKEQAQKKQRTPAEQQARIRQILGTE